MDNNQKILIAAIIVILIILVGAFALSGSNNATPSVTPTATPVITSTPTPVPAGNSTGASTPTPTAVVSATPTPVPSVTPTPVPESGVKLTEFGYWITYPPLGPQNWSTNPPPKGPQNVVYFDPTSDDVSTIIADGVSVAGRGPQGETIVHRDGDLSGTVTVTILASNSSNTWLVTPLLATHMYNYRVYRGENLTYAGGNTYTLVFGPGVSEQEIYVPIEDIFAPQNVDIATHTSFLGTVKLTITGVDGGYSIGDKNEFTVNINPPFPVVQFDENHGSLYVQEGVVNSAPYIISIDNSSNDKIKVTVAVDRTVSTNGALPVSFDWDVSDSNIPADFLAFDAFEFADGAPSSPLTVELNKSYVMSGASNTLTLYIVSSPNYYVGPQNTFDIYINQW